MELKTKYTLIRGAFLTMNFFVTLLFVGSEASAHSRLKPSTGVVPRSTNPGLKVGPCGGIARTATPANLMAGQQLTVTWEETIQHPGRYEFYFSAAGDLNFQLLSKVDDVQDNPANLPHQYTTTITLPFISCTDCTLQMIQVMTENPANPTYYYSCADILMTGGPTPIPTPTPAPGSSPAPTATPSTDDHCSTTTTTGRGR